jgi:hypothetical protein
MQEKNGKERKKLILKILNKTILQKLHKIETKFYQIQVQK